MAEQQGLNIGTGQRSMTRVQQPDTQIGVNVPSLQVAQGRPIDFRGLLQLGEAIVEGQQKDMASALFTSEVKNYQQSLSQFKETNPNWGDADITKFNTMFRQNMAMKLGSSGASLADLNSALTAFDKLKESEDQFTIDFSDGDYATRIDKNGNVQIFSNPIHQTRLQSEAKASFGPLGNAYLNNLEQTDPELYNQELTRATNMAWRTQRFTMENAELQAIHASAVGKRELQAELSRDAIIRTKRDIFNQTRTEALAIAQQVRSGRLTPEEGGAIVKERLSQYYLNSKYTEALIDWKQDPEETLRTVEGSVNGLIDSLMAASDPNVELNREHLAAKWLWETGQTNFLLELPESNRRQIALMRELANAAQLSYVVSALSPTDAAILLKSNQESVTAFISELEPLREADSGPEQWVNASNMLDRALINATSEYNIDDAPVVQPAELAHILKTMMTSPKYMEYVPEASRKRHQQLLNRVYDNFMENSGLPRNRVRRILEGYMEEEGSDPTSPWWKFWSSEEN